MTSPQYVESQFGAKLAICYYLLKLSRSYVSKHRGRTYLFQLNPVVSIDSSKAGNESRFINHAEEEKANCNACSEYSLFLINTYDR